MKYYLIAGEASGDLHASRLMTALKGQDPEAEFRFYGGDQMLAAGGTMVRHYRELAYMGFIPVLLHLPTILKNMRQAKEDIARWKPDVVILVDYPGFNLNIAKYVKEWKVEGGKRKENTIPQVYYYISPKIWAWKEYRIKNIKRDVDELFSILPFEVEFFEQKHHYPIHYVGNPTKEEVGLFQKDHDEDFRHFCHRHGLNPEKKIVALLAGSRRQEIKDNLPAMMEAARQFPDYQFVLAGAPAIDDAFYATILLKHDETASLVRLVKNDTYALLAHAHAALVTSGTATLETALFRVPQVVCYETPLPRLIGWLRKRILKVKYISLVNLIADREVVRELVADSFTIENITRELSVLLHPDSPQRLAMLHGYDETDRRLGTTNAPEEAACIMVQLLQGGH